MSLSGRPTPGFGWHQSGYGDWTPGIRAGRDFRIQEPAPSPPFTKEGPEARGARDLCTAHSVLSSWCPLVVTASGFQGWEQASQHPA